MDARGLFLMPGLADMHVHTWRDADLALFVAYGVTTVRNLFGHPLHLEMRRRVEAGLTLGPSIVTAGPILDGDPPVWQGSDVVVTPEEAVEAVRRHRLQGYDFVKPYTRLSEPVYAALVAEAEGLGMPVAGHVPLAVGLESVLAGPQDSIEHLDQYASLLQPDPGLRGDTSLRSRGWLTADPALMPPLAERIREAGVTSVPTAVLWEKLGLEDPEPEFRRPEARWVGPELLDQWRQLAPSPEYAALLREGRAARLAMTRALADADAPLLMGTDVGNPYLIPGVSALEELALLVEAGLTPYRALAAATRDAARFLGTPGELGTIVLSLL